MLSTWPSFSSASYAGHKHLNSVKPKFDQFKKHCGAKYRLDSGTTLEPDLTTAARYVWDDGVGFPPGFTVDELRYHRRRRPTGDRLPKDHLTLETGTYKDLKSEYRRRFPDYYQPGTRNTLHYDLKDLSPVRTHKPGDHLGVHTTDDETDDDELRNAQQQQQPPQRDNDDDGDAVDVKYELAQSLVSNHRRYKRYKRHAPTAADDIMLLQSEDNVRSCADLKSDYKSHYVPYGNVERRTPIRGLANLKLEGDLAHTTEKAAQFIHYLLSARRELIRAKSHLRPSAIVDGETMMEKKTETSARYVPHADAAGRRPPLYKKLTHLRLEGDIDTTTENHERYVPYNLEARPPLVKRGTNLRLEGEHDMQPEYRHEYVEHKSARSSPSLPRHNLRVDGFFDAMTESHEKFIDHQPHPPIPFLRGSAFNRKLLLGDEQTASKPEYREQYVPHHLAERATAFKRGENLSLEGDFATTTENRQAYVKQSPVKTELRRAASNLHLAGQQEHRPEYRNAYVDFYKTSNFSSPERRRQTQSTHFANDLPRYQPSVRKPLTHFASEGEMDHIVDKRSSGDAKKREPEFQLDGDWVCQPEYRRAYANYLIRERLDANKQRPLDNIGVAAQPPKRAFEVLMAKQQKADATTTPSTTSDADGGDAKSKTKIPVASKKPPPSPTTTKEEESTTTTSTAGGVYETSAATSRIPRRRPSLGTLETQLFGPKIEMPKPIRSSSSSRLSSSRTPSPAALPPTGRRTRSLGRRQQKVEVQVHRDRTGSRYSRSVRVEDLAYTPVASPIPTHKLYSYTPPTQATRKRWDTSGRDSGSIGDQIDRMSAFMVLQNDHDDDDVNNNSDAFADQMRAEKCFYNEQKWMPSWNSPTM